MTLPEDWVELPVEHQSRFDAELQRELCPSHQLYGRRLSAFAKRGRRDDYLFRAPTGDARVFLVHLTWSVETDPSWPWTEVYRDMADFLERWPREELESDDDGAAG